MPLAALHLDQLDVEHLPLLRREERRGPDRRSELRRHNHPPTAPGFHPLERLLESRYHPVDSQPGGRGHPFAVGAVDRPAVLVVRHVVERHLLAVLRQLTLANLEVLVHQTVILRDVARRGDDADVVALADERGEIGWGVVVLLDLEVVVHRFLLQVGETRGLLRGVPRELRVDVRRLANLDVVEGDLHGLRLIHRPGGGRRAGLLRVDHRGGEVRRIVREGGGQRRARQRERRADGGDATSPVRGAVRRRPMMMMTRVGHVVAAARGGRDASSTAGGAAAGGGCRLDRRGWNTRGLAGHLRRGVEWLAPMGSTG